MSTALWSLTFFLAGLGLGAVATTLHHQALRDDRHYQEQSYWVTRDKLEQLQRNVRWLARNPRLFYRVVLRAQRITKQRETGR